MDFFKHQGVYFIGSFWRRLRSFADQNGPKGDHMKMNFDYFQIQKWILRIARVEKVDEKNEVIYLFPCFLPELWLLNELKKCILCNFVLNSAISLSLLKPFTYMHLKVLIPLFYKMIWFIELWATVHEILAIKISKIQQNSSTSYANISIAIISNTTMNNTIF